MRIIKLQAGAGLLGLTLCPGILLSHDDPASPDRRIALHLRQLQDWGAAALVSLLEEYEFELLNVTRLGSHVERSGMEWLHLPIEHHALPDEWFEMHWTYVSHRILQLLSQGRRVAIHCRAGFGRTGTVTARLLMEMGEDLDVAVTEAEKVETGLQPNLQRAAYLEAMGQSRRDLARESRVLGCLLGGAVGDGLGLDQELDDWDELRDAEDRIHFEPHLVRRKDLQVSHVTQMSLFTLEGMAGAAQEPGDDFSGRMRLAYLDWQQTQEPVPGTPRHGNLWLYKELQVKQDPSRACLSSLATGGEGTLQTPVNNVRDCGALARTAPLGLLPNLQAASVMDLAAESAAITHGHPEEIWSAAALAGLTHHLARGAELTVAAERVCAELQDRTGAEEVVPKLQQALQMGQSADARPLQDADQLGRGLTAGEALAASLYFALQGDSFVEVLSTGANQIDNSHVAASLAGQLYGAAHGVMGLPHAWVRRLDVYDAANSVLTDYLTNT